MRNICFDRNTFYFDFTLCRSCLVGNIPLFDRGKCLLCQTLVSVVTDTSPCHAEHKHLLSIDNQLDFRRTVWAGSLFHLSRFPAEEAVFQWGEPRAFLEEGEEVLGGLVVQHEGNLLHGLGGADEQVLCFA